MKLVMTSHPRPYLTTLTPLRGIAALIVVVFHSNLMLMRFMPMSKPHVITAGWLWVDFFFVLSGFILSYVYGENFKGYISVESYWTYIKARFARVYPLHFCTMIWCLICATVIIQKAEGIHPFFRDMLNPMSAIPSTFLMQSLGFYISAPLNTPSWSLSTEWWMYMIFPLLVPLFNGVKLFGKILTFVGIAGIFLLVKYYLGPVHSPFPGGSPSLNVIADFGIFRCAAGFLLGMFLFSIYNESIAINFFRQSWTFFLFFTAAIIAMHIGTEDILVIALFPLIILSAAYNKSGVKKILGLSFLQRLGDWSFSIYMVHVPIMYLFWIYQTIESPTRWAKFPPAPADPSTYPIGVILCVALMAVTLFIASITYKYVEVPARNYLNKRFGAKVLEPAKVVNS